MLEIRKEGILLKKTTAGFESKGVLNPAAIREGESVHLFYRAVDADNHSSIGYCKMAGPLSCELRLDSPILTAEFAYESNGVEDPRITKIDDLYYLTYTAYDGVNALGALATSKDLVHFEKQGIIVPKLTYTIFEQIAGTNGLMNEKYLRYNERKQVNNDHKEEIWVWDKNVIFFPRRINNQLYFLHRIKPDIQLVSVNSLTELTLEFWQAYLLHFNEHIVLSPKYKHEVSYIGGGCPPIETEEGWLLIYHSVHDTVGGYVYAACAALLDLEYPQKELSRLPHVLFMPEYDWELSGEVNNVCFPTGTAVFNDILYIYYGAADEQIACASVSLSALVKELLLYKHKEKVSNYETI